MLGREQRSRGQFLVRPIQNFRGAKKWLSLPSLAKAEQNEEGD